MASLAKLTTVSVAAAMLLTLVPVDAQAQRRAVRVRVSAPRTTVVVSRNYRPYYYGSYYYDPFFYDWSYPYPYYYSAQFPYPYGRRGYYDDSGSVRLQVRPRQTEVFVDGYYAGTVDEFDGMLQRLHLEPGEHELTLYLAGHRSFTQQLYLQPAKTFNVHHDMVPLGAGEASPPRPTGGPIRERAGRDDDYDRPRDRDLPPPARRGDRDREPNVRVRDRAGDGRERAAEGFGSLALRVQPADAEILVDGEKWQGSGDERLVIQLGAGPHTIEIRKSGYRTYMTDVTVRPGETASVNVAMTKN